MLLLLFWCVSFQQRSVASSSKVGATIRVSELKRKRYWFPLMVQSLAICDCLKSFIIENKLCLELILEMKCSIYLIANNCCQSFMGSLSCRLELDYLCFSNSVASMVFYSIPVIYLNLLVSSSSYKLSQYPSQA